MKDIKIQRNNNVPSDFTLDDIDLPAGAFWSGVNNIAVIL